MGAFSRRRLLPLLMAAAVLWNTSVGRGAELLVDRTLVAWVANADSSQRNVSPMTIQDGPSIFDGLVYAEIRPRTWMAGSDYFHRTERDQSVYQEDPETGVLHRFAIVTRGREVELWRDDTLVSRYTIPGQLQTFPADGPVLFGVHHLDLLGAPKFRGEIEDARIYDRALTAEEIQTLVPDAATGPAPSAWWRFDDGVVEATGRYPAGFLHGRATVDGGRLRLAGGFAAVGLATELPSRDTERLPRWHVSALPEEGLCRSYDANGCLFWKGRYHLMYIYQDPELPHGGHCWGHASSTDLVDWTFHPPALVPAPGDPDVGIFSGNAFLDADGRPRLCWFGVDAGVCVATAEDDALLHWRKSPSNPVIPIPKPGDRGHGQWHVWDPYLWWDGRTYRCLLGGNRLPDGGDSLGPVLADGTRQIVVTVLASPDGRERTRIVYDVVASTLAIDAAQSTLRGDVNYQFHPLDSGGVFHDRAAGEPHRCPVTTAPFVLAPGEPLQLRILLDGPILEVFANSRQCLTQQVFPKLAESRAVGIVSLGGRSRLLRARGLDMAPARFTNEKHSRE